MPERPHIIATKLLRKTALVTLLFLAGMAGCKPVWASHSAGGNINFTCLGQNQYLVELEIFWDCSGPTPSSFPQTLNLTSTCGSLSVPLPLCSSDTIDQLCPSVSSFSTCNGGVLPGYYHQVFCEIITLPPGCTWDALWQVCCRSNSVNLIGTPTLILEGSIVTDSNSCNSSPPIKQYPQMPYFCLFQNSSYSFATTDPDGDSLVYSFSYPNISGFTPGYSVNAPISGMTLDPQTGLATFTGTIAGSYVISVRIDQYDSNGNHKGYTLVDRQFILTTCNNQNPGNGNFYPLINNTTSCIPIDSNVIVACEGSQACFSITIPDPDTLDTLSIASNIAVMIPGATVTTSGINPITATICFNHPSSERISHLLQCLCF